MAILSLPVVSTGSRADEALDRLRETLQLECRLTLCHKQLLLPFEQRHHPLIVILREDDQCQRGGYRWK